jgi:hypothetical protein
MIRHTVMWKLGATEASERTLAVAAITNALEALRGAIPGLLELTVSSDLGETDGNFDVVLVTDHESADALAVYQSHPAHLEAAGVVKAHVSARACVDSAV